MFASAAALAVSLATSAVTSLSPSPAAAPSAPAGAAPAAPAAAPEASGGATPGAAAAPETSGGATPGADGLEVRGRRAEPGARGRAAEAVTRAEMEERQARSLPDALRGVSGVSIQQTSHGQASPFIRGLTGQRTLMLFDGFRLNHALFRQGPNQYLFTVDRAVIDRAQVVRGSASVVLGTDALGGAILLTPREPRFEAPPDGEAAGTARDLRAHPRLEVRHATQDAERGGRAELDWQFGEATALLVGVGAREADLLESAGPVTGPSGAEPQSPCFDVNGRTVCVDREGVPPPDPGARRLQHGTGYQELTADARLVHRLDAGQRLTAAAYVYREYDAPRTDLCPPPEATAEECMVYEEQFRTHAYGKAQLAPGLPGAARLTLGAGYQRYHEKRRLDRPLSYTALVGRDDVDMVDVYAQAKTATRRWGDAARLEADYGLTATRETVASKAWTIFTSSLTGRETVFPQPRGVYVDGSRFLQGGAWAEPVLTLYDRLALRAGGRVAFARARADGDDRSQTTAVDGRWTMAVANAGAELQVVAPLTLLLSAEQGVRPPNLDDLTARQATGRGYQLENPTLRPERSLSLEAGLRLAHGPVFLEGWVFRTTLEDTMERRRAECPPSDLECRANRAPLQIANVAGQGEIVGAEALGRLALPLRLQLAANVSWAEGETDNPLRGLAAQDAGKRRVPMSRIAPLNGAVDLAWHGAHDGLYAGSTFVWSAAQTELSYGDTTDARIPKGGTPGFRRVDLRAGLRLPDRFACAVVLENLFDEPYRIHGSGVNGPGRGLVVNVEVMR